MFYSNKEFIAACFAPGGLDNQSSGDTYRLRRLINDGAKRKDIAKLLSKVKQSIVNRDTYYNLNFKGQDYSFGTCKWFRPWDIVPALRNYVPPEGDYGIGVEVEIGFTTREAARRIIGLISRWKHITVDYEGPAQPAEVTFPPVLYSKFSSRSQACKYLKLLAANASDVYRHGSGSSTGTHINVSKGGVASFNSDRTYNIAITLDSLSRTQEIKYFGRMPYGYVNRRASGGTHYLEYKLFNSTKDWRVLRRYVDIAVALTDLIADTTIPINRETVVEALEEGYNKHSFKELPNAA